MSSSILAQSSLDWHRGVAVITTAQLHSTKLEPGFVQVQILLGTCWSEIQDGEDL